MTPRKSKKNLKTFLTVISSITVIFFLAVLVPIFISARCYPKKYKNYIESISEKYEIDKNLVYGVVKTESGFNPYALSSAGAVGLMQLMPETAEFIAKENNIPLKADKLTEPEYNITLGILYLNYLTKKFTKIEHVLLAYNAGEGKVSKWLDSENPTLDTFPYVESRNYVHRVNKAYKVYSTRRLL